MIDIYCRKNKCPICGSKTEVNLMYLYKKCINECYQYNIYITGNGGDFYIFNKLFLSISDKEDNFVQIFLKKRKIKKQIKYWKKNNRYLIEILKNNKN